MPQAPAFGVRQRMRPLASSTAIISGSPPGARITASPSISGHWPAYHGGTVAPNCLTRSNFQTSFPVRASRQVTWHIGPRLTTKRSLTAGTVRDMPWLRWTLTE